jgi:hypothetical protein
VKVKPQSVTQRSGDVMKVLEFNKYTAELDVISERKLENETASEPLCGESTYDV